MADPTGNVVAGAQGNAQSAISGIADIAPQSQAGLEAGMNLAQRQQQLDQQKQDLQFKKDQHTAQVYSTLHDSLHQATQEDDPAIRKALIEEWGNNYQQLTGNKANPAIMKLADKSDTFRDRLGNYMQMYKAIQEHDPDQLQKLNPELDYAMTGSPSDAIKSLASFQSNQLALQYKQSMMENAQKKTSAIQQGADVRQASAMDNVANQIIKSPNVQKSEAASFQAQKAINLLNKGSGNVRWIDFAEANIDIAGLMQNGASVIPEGRRNDVDFAPAAKKLDTWNGKIQGQETGGPSQDEIDLVKDRLSRLTDASSEYHDRELLKEIQARKEAIGKLGMSPSDLYNRLKQNKSAGYTEANAADISGIPQSDQSANAASQSLNAPKNVPGTSPPPGKVAPSLDQARQMAQQAIQNAKENNGVSPHGYTEDEIRKKFKSLYGQDL